MHDIICLSGCMTTLYVCVVVSLSLLALCTAWPYICLISVRVLCPFVLGPVDLLMNSIDGDCVGFIYLLTRMRSMQKAY